MKTLFPRLFLILACVVLVTPLRAERADRNKPMNIEADSLRYDDVKQTSVFIGRVVVTKGTMVIRGAQLDVRQDSDGNQFGVMKAEPGKRAFFRQKRDTRPGTQDEFMEGEADLIDYDGKADVVKFIQRAEMRRYLGTVLNDEMSGVVIVYDNSTSVLTVDGGNAKVGPDGNPPRARAMLTPRVNDESRPGAVAPAAAASAAATLRRSATLGGVKK
ncbi:MAG: lipopolysaccharide transport periplasmic protein LptA [Rhodoferax sp.]|nr:lipopolysaccharide transport periplasmic protein LptA [Rhodoferax sp.]